MAKRGYLNEEQQAEFDRLIELGRVRVDIADALLALIERVGSEAWSRGIDQALSDGR